MSTRLQVIHVGLVRVGEQWEQTQLDRVREQRTPTTTAPKIPCFPVPLAVEEASQGVCIMVHREGGCWCLLCFEGKT